MKKWILSIVSLVVASTTAASGIVSGAVVEAARAPACASTYDVVSGDYWIKIAGKAGVTTSALYTANGASASTALYPGMQICLPDGASTPTPTTAPPPTASTGGMNIAAFPVQGPCWFTDSYGAPRSGGRSHEGVDIIAKEGLLVYAVLDGTLTKQTTDRPGSLSGNAWWLSTASGAYLFYAHLSAFAPDLKVGSQVKAGQVIGFVGSTGNAAGAHLHFEVHPTGGASVNPTPVVKSVDGCKNSTPLPQPSGSAPPAASNTPPTTAPAAPPATSPANTAPAVVLLPTQSTTQPGSLWQFISPRTVFDSSLRGGTVQTIRVNNVSGVPTSTAGVMVRLTAASAASTGYLVTHACDSAAPFASTLSFSPGRTSVGSAVIRVVGGNVCITSSTSVSLDVEILAAQASSGVGLVPMSAKRAIDTRTTTRLVPGASLSLSPGLLGADSGTQALSTSITLVNPAGAGTLAIGFCGQGGWQVPFTEDWVSSFSVAMRLNNSGWCLTTTAPVDVIVDVVGRWTTGATLVATVDPVRVFDSRSTTGPIGYGGATIQIAGLGGVPSGATTAVVSVTTVTGAGASSVFVFVCGEPRSEGTVIASSGYRISTAVVTVGLGGGAMCISSFTPIDVIVDVIAAG